MTNPISVLLIIGAGIATVLALAGAVAGLVEAVLLWFDFCWRFSPIMGGICYFSPLLVLLIVIVFWGGAYSMYWWLKQ